MNGMTIDQFREAYCYHYVGEVPDPIADHVHDGDTFTMILDLGTDVKTHSFKVRPIGYNSPEVVGAERMQGLEAKQFLIDLLEDCKHANGKAWLAVQTVKNPQQKERMSGARYLAHVWILGPDGQLRDLWKLMVAAGYGEVA